jgi:ABC-type sugar transport system ATPase subunit
MAGVELDSLTVRFGDVVAVDNVSLRFGDGDFTVLLGPSGCGKTTTLRCVAGLDRATSGHIRFDGESVGNLSPKEREVAMVFQFVSLYPHLSVRENIAFPLRARGERGTAVIDKVNRMARVFDLTTVLDKRPHALPPGTWQKASLARAVVREPKVLLLDEPLSSIDEQFLEEMRWELRHIQKDLGMTTIHVTHDQREAMSLADRVILMRDGGIVQEGTPMDLYDLPEDLFAAHFIGSPSMNLIPATVSAGVVRIGDQAIPLPHWAADAVRLRGADEITLGIRPHDTVLEDHSNHGMSATVLNVSSNGRERFADFELGGALCKGLIPEGFDVDAHAAVKLNTRGLLLFDSNGHRIGA